MQATTISRDSYDERREARRAAELVEAASEVLREEIAENGAMSRALDRLARVARSLEVDHGAEVFTTAVQATHDALSDALRIGSAVKAALEPRGQQCVDSLGAAQRILYPVAKAHGVVAPPPLPSSRAPQPGADEGPRPDERRASPRVDLAVDVGFESENNFYQGFSEDLSDGGLFVATYQLQPIGSTMDVEFTLPDGHIVRARAVVRWLRDLRDESEGVHPGMGLSFETLPPEDERAIGAFVRARSPIFFDDDL